MFLSLLKEIAASIRRPAKGKGHERGSPAAGSAMSEAEAKCRRMLDAMPHFSDAHNELGVVLDLEGRWPEAEASFRTAFNLNCTNVAAAYNLANVCARTGRPREAEAMYRDALRLLPGFVEAHDNLGVVLMNSQRHSEAEAAFRRALELKPDFAAAREHMAVLFARNRDPAASAAARRAPEAAPDPDPFLANAKRYAGEAALRRAIALDPGDAAAQYDLGVTLVDGGRTAEAESMFRAALDAKPDFFAALSCLGNLLADTSRPEEAATAYRRALKLHPNSPDICFNLGIILARTRKLREACDAYDAALRLEPDYPAARQNLEFVSREVARLSKAEDDARAALAAAPDDPAGPYRLGLASLALGKSADAAAAMRRVLALDANHAGALRNLGVALLAQQQTDAAIECLLRAVAVKPAFAGAMADLGAAYLAAGEFEQSTRWSQAALAVEPLQRDANQSMASILKRTDRGSEAKPYAERASSRPPVYVEHGTQPVRTVLVIWAGTLGNVPTVDFLFPITSNTRVNRVFESADADTGEDLPDYDLVFNAAGDSDVSKEAAAPIERFAGICVKPLLNHPAKVARTARYELPSLLAHIDHILVPEIWRFDQGEDWDKAIADQLPLLIRPIDSHGGRDLALVRTREELEQANAARSGPVYATRFVDFRSADSYYRKFRTVFIDREPYPVHLAISPKWMVHYASAEMEAHAWKLAEEKEFLRDQDAFLGAAAMKAIREIGQRMDLDYAGIDFSVLPDSRILVFEANPTMLIHPEEIGGPLAHRNDYIFSIQKRFEALLQRLERPRQA